MRIFLSLVGILNLHTYQLDIKTEFLNASYVKPVYDQVSLRRLTDQRRGYQQEWDLLQYYKGVVRLRTALYCVK